jgi:uncharacterized protein (TIGR03067 family)
MKLRALLIVAAALLVAADAKDDAVKKDKEALQGTWKPVAREKNGKLESEKDPELAKTRFVFKGDKLIEQEGKNEDEYTFTIDPTQKPKAIDLSLKVRDEVLINKGIYELDGDTLRICLATNPDASRPTKFETKQGSKTVMGTFKREK